MGVFDLDVATKLLAGGGSPVDALGMSFGVPTCLMELGKSAAMAFLPSSLVVNVSEQVQAGIDSALDEVAELKQELLMENGFFEIDTENGTFRFKSDSSDALLDANSGQAINDLLGFTSGIAKALTLGAAVYENTVDVIDILTDQVDCVKSYTDFLKSSNSDAGKTSLELALDNLAKYETSLSKIKVANEFIVEAQSVVDEANKVIIARLENPELEPVFNADLIPSGTTFKEVDFEALATQASVIEPEFRLVFGPPKTKSGKFLLSVDGLYYDSQNGGLPEVSGFVPSAEKYKFDYPANLGGKGTMITSDDLIGYVDTLFDPNQLDESPSMQTHYDADHFLSVLTGQKDKQTFDLSGQIAKLEASGYDSDSALIINLVHSMYAAISIHEDKISRRKKQIEVAVKAPDLFGSTQSFPPGSVPINDFTFLQAINVAVALEKQKKLVLKQTEVSGVVLPLTTKFVKCEDSEGPVIMDHLVVPPVGVGGIIYDTSGNDSETTAVLSLNDLIVTDKLFAIYNFLDSNVVSSDSLEFSVTNCATSGNGYNNAHLAALSPETVFKKGLGIPWFDGIYSYPSVSTSTLGSFVKLPNTQEFQNMTYKPNGFTIEAWMHVPDLTTSGGFAGSTGWQTSGFHKVLLGCENNGGTVSALDEGKVVFDNGSETVRGMVMGITRDRQIVSGLAPTATEAENPMEQAVFYVAPTQAVNTSNITFVNKNEGGCASSYETLRCAVSLSSVVNGVKYGDTSSTFVQVALVVKPKNNTVRLYCDGTLMTTSSTQDVFGVHSLHAPGVPTFAAINSFQYSAIGPPINDFFTPWIVGGGYSEGIGADGFMGQNSGFKSGLQGYVGSLKFYKKALSTSEVLKNYNAQKGFFKNIDL